MTTLVVVLSAVLLCVVVSRSSRRRRDDDDLRAAQKTAGVGSLGEAPAFPHHRMGSAGQSARRRW